MGPAMRYRHVTPGMSGQVYQQVKTQTATGTGQPG